MTNRSIYLLAAVLAAAGLTLFLYKVLVLEFPASPGDRLENWEIEARVSFTATGGPATVRLFVPRNTRGYTILDQSFVSRGYVLTTDQTADGRMALLTRRQAKGPQTVYFRFLLHRAGPVGPGPQADPTPPAPPGWKGRRLEAARALLDRARADGPTATELARSLIAILAGPDAPDAAATLVGRRATAERIAGVAVGTKSDVSVEV